VTTTWDFALPEIYCPFPSAFVDSRHSATHEVELAMASALRNNGSTSVRRAVSGIHLVDYAGRLYPDVTTEGPANGRLVLCHLLGFGRMVRTEG